MGFKVNLIERLGFPDGVAGNWVTQFPAWTYPAATYNTESIDIRLYHQVGVVATTCGVDITGNTDIFLEMSTAASGAAWITATPTWQRGTSAAGLLLGDTILTNTWTAASVAVDNVIFDAFKTETLPDTYTHVRLGLTNAAEQVVAALIFATDANYSDLGDWGDHELIGGVDVPAA